MTYRLHIGWNPNKKFLKRRKWNGVWQARFGGRAIWWRGDKRYVKEVKVWGPASLQDDDCGHDTDIVVNLLLKKIDPTGKRKAEIIESWRY